MNSTGISFKTSVLSTMFCMIDEYSFRGDDPRTHSEWEPFMAALKKEHSTDLSGILILIYYPNGRDADPAFAMMLILKEDVTSEDKVITYYEEIFSIHKGRTIVDFVEL